MFIRLVKKIENTVKLVYNDYPWNPKILATIVVFQRSSKKQNFKLGVQNGGRCRQLVVSSGLQACCKKIKYNSHILKYLKLSGFTLDGITYPIICRCFTFTFTHSLGSVRFTKRWHVYFPKKLIVGRRKLFPSIFIGICCQATS